MPPQTRAIPVLPKIEQPELVPIAAANRPQIALSIPLPIVTAAAPPLKTDNLASLTLGAPGPARPRAIQSAAFPETALPSPSGSGTTRFAPSVGAFAQLEAKSGFKTRRSAVEDAGFEQATVAVPEAAQSLRTAVPSTASATKPLDILSKPHPEYTAEARRLQIEGEVLVDVLFTADDKVRVMGVVRGLGHGLDENAQAAARAIRFHPAERAGSPVDSRAIVHIIFQLAY